jgi:type I restriction enzyme R subunit
MDFRNVTRLFADPDFDGEAVESYESKAEESFSVREHLEKETISEAQLVEQNPHEEILIDGTEENPKPKKIHITDGVTFDVIHKIVQYIDPATGKLRTDTIQKFSEQTILGTYATLEDFLNRWNVSERKEAIISELAAQGILFDGLREDVGKECDIFDLILHVA